MLLLLAGCDVGTLVERDGGDVVRPRDGARVSDGAGMNDAAGVNDAPRASDAARFSDVPRFTDTTQPIDVARPSDVSADVGRDPCLGIACSGHGTCVATGSTPRCNCVLGYHSVGTECVVDAAIDRCAGVTCSGHGTCSAVSGVAVCLCDPGFHVSGLSCITSSGPDPCTGVTCEGHGTCLSDRGRAICHCDPGYHQAFGVLTCRTSVGSVCASVSCGGAGTCAASGSAFGVEAVCACDPGYVTYGLACVLESRLFCRDTADALVPRGTPRCSADASHVESCFDTNMDGLLEWGNAGFACPGRGTCTPECLRQDCTIAGCPNGGACMANLDGHHVGLCMPACNCGNCGNCGAGGSFVAFQAHCGNRSGAPATTACSSPCPGVRDGCIPLPISGGGFCFTDQGCFSAPPR